MPRPDSRVSPRAFVGGIPVRNHLPQTRKSPTVSKALNLSSPLRPALSVELYPIPSARARLQLVNGKYFHDIQTTMDCSLGAQIEFANQSTNDCRDIRDITAWIHRDRPPQGHTGAGVVGMVSRSDRFPHETGAPPADTRRLVPRRGQPTIRPNRMATERQFQ
jgi:hypothetical protein